MDEQVIDLPYILRTILVKESLLNLNLNRIREKIPGREEESGH
jgi:hypothetical protein